KSFGFEIKIDTNGSFPQRLKKIISEGLVDYLAMDIKAPPEKYHEVAGALVNLSEVEKSVEIIKESGIDYEFRTTVFSGLTPFDFERIGLWLQKAKRYYLQIANLDLPLLDEDFSKKFYSPRREELDEVMERILPFFEEVKIRG
ncbi:MAG: radical SAM protein, partial [Candidatus Margulisiibacteriota bacterium]